MNLKDVEYTMRNATEKDLEFVTFSELETVGENKNDPKVIKYIKQDAKDSLGHTKIIVVDNEDIGVYQAYATNKWGLREGKKDWWYLAHIYIKPEYRGMGIGTNIIKKDIKEHNKILLQVMKSNSKARKLYESLGFVKDMENDHGGIVMRYEKNETIQESYVDYDDSLIPVKNYKPNTVYFGTHNKLSDHINIKKQLFVTPYLGIASIFSAENCVIDELVKRGVYSSNSSYDEWNKTTGLNNIPNTVHVKIKVFAGRPFKRFEVYGTGYVYEIDISSLKDKIYLYDWMNKSREVLIANIDKVPIKSIKETKIKYIVEMENDLERISSNEVFRVEYDKKGIYEALKQAMIKVGKSDEWKKFLQLDAVKKLPEPPEYKTGYQSWFTSKGKREVWDKVKHIFYKYLDEDKFVYMVKSLKDLKEGVIVYSDEYQYVVDTNGESVQEEFIEESYRDSHFRKLYFHCSGSSHLDGQVLKPRVPEYLDRYDPEDTHFENDTTPRVCLSPSIEGCLNGISVAMPRTRPVQFDKVYVYIPEKPFNQYKHKTNKELIKDKDIFDANITKEVWILEPVRLKLYGVIQIDSVYNVKRKDNVPTASGKKSQRNYYKYKWHWLVTPKALDKGTNYNYDVMSVIRNMSMDVSTFKYGLIKDGKLITNPPEDDYDEYWRLSTPEEFEKAGGGICFDFVEWEAGYLDAYGVSCKKYFLTALNEKDGFSTHTFIIIENKDKFIYFEASFKDVVKKMGKFKEFDSLEDIFKYVINCMNEFVYDGKNKFQQGIFDYTDATPKQGSTIQQFIMYIVDNGELVYESKKSKKE